MNSFIYCRNTAVSGVKHKPHLTLKSRRSIEGAKEKILLYPFRARGEACGGKSTVNQTRV